MPLLVNPPSAKPNIMIISKKSRVALKRVLWVFIPAVLVLVLGVGLLDGYVIYRLTRPPRTKLYGSPRDFQVILQKPMWTDEKWKNSDGTQSIGWLLNQGRPGPAVILSHGYGSNRSELLSLSFEFWKAGYHVLVYDLRGHGESPVMWSGLGTYEKDDLLSAINYLKGMKVEGGQPLVDGRIGLFGVEIGGYASLLAASESQLVKAVAVDSTFPDAARYINYKLKTYVGDTSWANSLIDSSLTNRLIELAMQVYLLRREDAAPALDAVSSKTGKRFLFIVGNDSGALGLMTRQLYAAAVDQKQLVQVDKSRLNRLYEQASADYDAQVVAYFRDAMPVVSEKTAAAARRSK